MADTVISDAIAYPHDEGLPNIADGNETWNSAGLVMVLAQMSGRESYARSTEELDFAGHDGTNDTVDVQAGVAYLSLAGETVDVQSTRGGSIPPAYDTTLPTLPAIAVIVPSAVTVDVQSATLSQVWVAYATDGNVTGVDAGDIYVRSDDTGSVSAPPHPSVELGSANPDDAGADTLVNRGSSLAPSGMITMWSGATTDIPSGWTLCDGTDGAPDLRDKFVTGAGGQYAVGDSGGQDTVTLTEAEMPQHTHAIERIQGYGQYDDDIYAPSGENVTYTGESSSGVHPAGNDEAHENRPPYYAIAFVMKL